jgi:hypothetical protein
MTDKRPRREFLAQVLTFGTGVALAGGPPCCLLRAMAANAATGGKPQRPLDELGYCGFECDTECETYRATLHNDLAEKKRIADRWNAKYGLSLRAEDVACDGCRSSTGRLGYHCGNICAVRKCGRSRAISSCAACADFPTCDKQLWKDWPAMRQRTEERQRALRDAGRLNSP